MANAQDSRLKKSDGEAHADRAEEDTQRTDNDGTTFTQSERRRMFRNEWTQEALPAVPEIPGFHLCWLSTNNQYDPIHKRLRLGYEPVTSKEVPGYEHLKMKSGEFEGVVSINEMILCKLPLEIYQELMAELHYHMPLEEEEKIRVQAVRSGQTDSAGRPLELVEGDGFKSMGTNKPSVVPSFT